MPYKGVDFAAVDGGLQLDKDEPPAGTGRIGQHPGAGNWMEVGSMKPRWIRVRKRRTQRGSGGGLQAGLLVFQRHLWCHSVAGGLQRRLAGVKQTRLS